MDRVTRQEIEDSLRKLHGLLERDLSPQDMGRIMEYITVGEYGLALHNAVYAIIEDDKRIPGEALLIIQRLSDLMKIRNLPLDELPARVIGD